MWTYRRPHHPEELTKKNIEERGKLALSRALSIGRVIGFVASGATVGYGQPSWKGLARKAYDEATKLSTSTRNAGASKTAMDRLQKLEKTGKLTDDIVHALGLAERVAIDTGQESQFRRDIASFFATNRSSQRDKNKTEEYRKSEPLRRIISDLRISRLLTLNYDSEIEEEFYRLFRTSGADSYHHVVDKQPSDFEILRSEDFKEALKLPARVEYTDGTTRSVLSMSMNASNIGDLVNFALQPMQFVGQVFHLHGRFDCPEDMVLTDRDYRATYLKSDEQAQTFDEALSALMSGNDILFVGVGMTEEDLLRPLRQFVSRDRTPEFSKRHVFAMRENSVSLDTEWLEGEGVSFDQDKEDFKTQHIDAHTEQSGCTTGSAYTDYAADESMAVNHRTEYGVYSIFHGGQALRTIRMANELLQATAPNKDKPSPFERRFQLRRYRAAVAATHDAIMALRDEAPAEIGHKMPDELLMRRELLSFARALAKSAEVVKRLEKKAKLLAEDYVAISPSKTVLARLSNLTYEARSRALDLALVAYAGEKDKWWAEWRNAPKNRNAQFQQTYLESDENNCFPIAARHRPDYKEQLPDDVSNFDMIQELQSLAQEACAPLVRQSYCTVQQELRGHHMNGFDSNQLTYFDEKHSQSGAPGGEQRNFFEVPPKRVLRASLPRGHGKGSLLHMLQQGVPEPDGSAPKRLLVDTLFDKSNMQELEKNRYFGSFFLHLSFSMEFASVISALKMFVEQATCGVIVEYGSDFAKKAKARLRTYDGDLPEPFLNYLKEFIDDSDSYKMVEGYDDLIRDGAGKRVAVTKLVEKFYGGFWGKQTLQQGSGRAHRLEELRSRLSAFTDVVDILEDKNIRLAIVMSGLDKLCDSEGTAYNPMFRALFRLLSNCGTKTASEADITTPLDLVLISGRKDLPLRYLSREFTKKQLKHHLARPGKASADSTYSSYTKYHPMGGAIYLEKWPVLPMLSKDQRYWLSAEHDQFLNDLMFKEDGKLKLPRDVKRGLRRREIARLCESSVALHTWVSGAFGISQALMERQTNFKTRAELRDHLNRKAVEFVSAMDAAAGRGGHALVMRDVIETHKAELRFWGAALLESLKGLKTTADFRSWPDPKLRRTTKHVSDVATESDANHMVDLVFVILSHLALFPMPVEPRVLYGCDEIKRLLAKICDAEQQTKFGKAGAAAKLFNWRDINRLVRLRLLSQVLRYLADAGLLIAVGRKPVRPTQPAGAAGDAGGVERTSADIHTRYTIQHQMRDFTARLMDLSLPDQGERNFFQVSVYCDQPRDLPAPREDHYALVRQIMDRQIEQCRNSIWVLLQLIGDKGDDRWQTLSKSDRPLMRYGLRRRIMKLSDQARDGGAPVVDPQIPSLHAVPQRIRALYGLLRSGFSIGTVSRLSALDEREIDQPYERFKGWLRGVTNAAIGWDYALDELFYQEDPHNRVLDDKKVKGTRSRIVNALSDLNACAQPPKADEVFQDFNGFARPLYRDEVGWLLNERGVVSLVQGQIFDAIPLFQRALDEMHHVDVSRNYDPALHAAVRRVRLNQAIALIDRGHLARAYDMLRGLQLPEDFSNHSGSQVSWLARGYIGLIDHLSGNLDVALTAYDETIGLAQDREMMRVVGIFSKHKADLLRRKSKFDDAHEAISKATSAALNCAQRDILHLAKVSEGNLILADPDGEISSASTCMIEALQFAQTMGIPRLETEARSLQAELMLAQGERMLAGSAASEAAAIANRNGLRLNKLRALRHYGASLRLRGQLQLASQVLGETRRESERRGYQGLAKSLANELRLIL